MSKRTLTSLLFGHRVLTSLKRRIYSRPIYKYRYSEVNVYSWVRVYERQSALNIETAKFTFISIVEYMQPCHSLGRREAFWKHDREAWLKGE